MQQLQSHDTNIEAIKYSPDGAWLASGSRSGVVQIWSFEDKAVRTIENGQWNDSLQFSADGRYLACQMKDERLGVWDVETLEVVQTLSNGSKPYWFAWSATSDVIAYTTHPFRSVEFWSPVSGTRLTMAMPDHLAEISALTFSPDGKWLVLGLFDGSVSMWEVSAKVNSLHEVDSLTVAIGQTPDTVVSGSVSSVAFLDGDLLAVTGSDGSVVAYSPFSLPRQWDLKTRVENGDSLFSPDGRFLAYGTTDGRIQIDLATTGKNAIRSEPCDSLATDIAFAAGAPRVAAALASHQVFDWTIVESRLQREATFVTPSDEHPPSQIALTRDGSKLLSVDEDERGIRVWDVVSETHERTLETRFGGGLLALSPDERLVAAGHDFVYVWEFATGRELLTLWDGDFISSLTFTHDSRALVTGHRDGSIRIREMPTGRLLQLMTGHHQSVGTVIVTPDSKSLVTADIGGVVRLWNLDTGEEFGVLYRTEEHSQVGVDLLSFNKATGCLTIGSGEPRQAILLLEPTGWRPE